MFVLIRDPTADLRHMASNRNRNLIDLISQLYAQLSFFPRLFDSRDVPLHLWQKDMENLLIVSALRKSYFLKKRVHAIVTKKRKQGTGYVVSQIRFLGY